MDNQPIVTDLVLVGGGHSHAIVLRLWGMQPLPGVRLTLISESSTTAYSGMVPGYIAGLYDREECYINLRQLAQFAGADFYIDRVIGIDLKQKQVICARRPAVRYDFLSIDVGSTPELPISVQDSCVIPAKPIGHLLEKWHRVKANHQETIAIVGGGVGGVELAFALRHQLPQSNFHLFHAGAHLLPGHNTWVQQRVTQKLRKCGVKIHLTSQVESITDHVLTCRSGFNLSVDAVFWVTQAAAPAWPKEAGLQVDAQGFILVNPGLQSVSHPDIFAAGDVATIIGLPRPKAGVFAVRQGQPLWANLRRRLLNQPLQDYIPQKSFLSLIGTADRSAIGSRGWWGWEAPWLWRWKESIDRQFMDRFRKFPEMSPMKSPIGAQVVPPMYCGGCGAKVGSTILNQTLERLQREYPDQMADCLDDAAIVILPPGKVIVQSVDHFPTLVNDPYLFGKITANHCLSDLYAMGATPQSVLAMVTLPHADRQPATEMLYQLLSGVLQVLAAAGATLGGGHTIAGDQMVLGLAAQGYADPDRILTKRGMQNGDVLILTKPLGIGTLFAAHSQLQARATWIDDAIEIMLQSNQQASQIFLEHQASACTDITGFGLIGHLSEMIGDNLGVILSQSAISYLPGALVTIDSGIFSSIHPQNLLARKIIANPLILEKMGKSQHLLFDPQTAGGLLAAIPAHLSDACLANLQSHGYSAARSIGVVDTHYPGHIFLR